MCSELFRIPLSVNGVPLFGVGVFLLLWLAATGWSAWGAVRQFGAGAGLKAHLPTMALGAAVLVGLPRLFPDGVPLRGYGLLVVTGMAAGVWLAVRRARQCGLDPEEIYALAMVMFVAGIVGARLFFLIEYWNESIHQRTATGATDWGGTLKAALSFTEGGLVVYGALIGAMLAFAWQMRRRKLPLLAMADLIAPGMAIGLALGRIGCLLNGCCYGGESTLPWAVTFPRENAPQRLSPPYADQAHRGRLFGLRLEATAKSPAGEDATGAPRVAQVDADSPAAHAGVKIGDELAMVNDERVESLADAWDEFYLAIMERRPVELRTRAGEVRTIAALDPPPARSRPMHPVQVYSAINAALLAWALWTHFPVRRRDGETIALTITLYPIARFCEEVIRIDESAVFGTGLSISQNISLGMLVLAALLWRWLDRQPAGQWGLRVRDEQV
ncbi:MAG: prolipoprotein diacylglyceryl transferase [Pirellulales bacterium]|nr:prolipoprotein diacylglyceryl transferase [Pirellulales bacterium]